ncbi:MAG TPA: hypothetical protein VK882_06625, partial [Nitrososphaeraceae archaeon]|nr:hypothetical protein [Nitrososphaeraceae archaeon]
LAAVTDETKTPDAATGEITESQESSQDPEINEAKVQQVADKINEFLVQEGTLPEDTSDQIKNLLYNELTNNPQGELSKSLEALAGIESFVSDDEATKKIAEKIIAKYPELDEITLLLIIQTVKEEVGKKWNRILDITIKEIYDSKGNLVGTKVLTELAAYKSSDSKKDRNDDRNDDRNHYYIKKIFKYQGNKCTTQSGSIPLAGKIPPKTPILIGDFYPCKLNDGRATLNLPNTQNLQFALIHLDNKDGNHEAVVVSPQKIQNVGQNNALFVVKFNDQFNGHDPITGQPKTIKDVNAIALFNKSTQTIDFEGGNGLGITAVLKS